eukprot:103263-Prymnesium_polylepis.1
MSVPYSGVANVTASHSALAVVVFGDQALTTSAQLGATLVAPTASDADWPNDSGASLEAVAESAQSWKGWAANAATVTSIH